MTTISITNLIELASCAETENLGSSCVLMNDIDMSPTNPDNVDEFAYNTIYLPKQYVKGVDGNVYHYLGIVPGEIESDDLSHTPGHEENTGAFWGIDPDFTGSGWTPIGSLGAAFTGTFDGNEFTLSNLFMLRAESVIGLFGQLSAPSERTGYSIKDLNISGATVVAEGFSGILIGSNVGGKIHNCQVSGSVTGTENAAGFAGVNGVISPGEGLGEISECSFIGDVSGANGSAGLCYQNQGKIFRSYSEVNAICSGINSDGGGFVASQISGAECENCYATGSVKANNSGGFIKGNEGSISNCYCAATVEAVGFAPSAKAFASSSTGTVTNCFYDSEVCTLGDSSEATGKTTSEMKSDLTYTSGGSDWNFDSVWGINSLYEEDINDGYPYFLWEHPYTPSPTPDPEPEVVTDVSGIIVLSPPTIKLTGTDVNGTIYDSTQVDVFIPEHYNYYYEDTDVTNQTSWSNAHVFVNQVIVELDHIYPQGNYPLPDFSKRIFAGSPAFGNLDAEIYYTLNGKNPTQKSRLYRQPLVFRGGWSGDSHITLKYRIYYSGKKSPICKKDLYIVSSGENIYNFDNLQE